LPVTSSSSPKLSMLTHAAFSSSSSSNSISGS
jgi:hypothetical protein